MSILILSFPLDAHASIIEWSLRQELAANVNTLFTSDFPERLAVSSRFNTAALPETLHDGIPARPTVVWNRRITRPSYPAKAHPDDADFVARENQRFFDGLWHTMACNALWINDFHAARRANSKAVQLAEAQRCGFRIPDTIFSNDQSEIRKFIGSVRECIYKPFLTGTWIDSNGRTHTTMTSLVSSGGELDDDQLRSCAGIYQERVIKQYEVRVTIFGGACFAVKILSQKRSSSSLDWRTGFYDPQHFSCEQIQLPSVIVESCFQLLRALGLVYGAIDLAITPEGECVFFELNEAGQFLWCEQFCPALPMLESFCQFLVSGDENFSFNGNKYSLSLQSTLSDCRYKEFVAQRRDGHTHYLPGKVTTERSV